MMLSRLVEASQSAASTRARRAKVDALATVLRELSSEELEPGAGFLYGELRQGRVGVGGAKLAQLRGIEPRQIAELTVAEVDATLERIASASGRGSSAQRERELGALFARATGSEQNFLARLLLGELRQGAQEGLMVEAIAQAATLPLDAVRRAVMLSGNLRAVAHRALMEGAPGLSAYRLQVLRPVGPMLASSAEDLSAALYDLQGAAAIEDKLDGARIQVHKLGDEVRIFSRQLNEVTASLPELVELARALPARSAVLDGEAIALKTDARPYPFQVTMRRFGRSQEVEKLRGELPLSAFFFDLLLLDDQELIDRPNSERRDALVTLIPEHVTRRLLPTTVDEAKRFVEEALGAGHEGAMLKALGSPYDAGRRGSAWLKLKPSHTLDLVVLGVEWGNGRRQGLLSNLHLGARDPVNDNFVMLGKTFKGMTDEMLSWQTQHLQELSTGQQGHVVYVRPELVVEIAFDGIQKSSVYPGGLALRFARVKRYRLDKTPVQADTIDTVRSLFQMGYGAPTSAM
jgi:DNA ligase 1